MSDQPPAILLLSDEGPQTGTAGGLLLHRLLRPHPPERLRVLARYVPVVGEPLPGVSYQQLIPPWTRFEKSRFNRLKRSLRACRLVPAVSARHLAALLGDFKPDVVLCVMQHASYYDTAWAYARCHHLPLVVIVHDVNDDFEPVLPWAQAQARNRDAAFYRHASRRLCVSPEMESYCRDRYGVAGSVLYPNRSPDLQPIPIASALTLRTPGRLTLGFAGNLGYGYGRELCRLLPALRQARSRLIVYARPPGTDCAALTAATDCVELRGFKPSAEAWAGIQRDCDAVWLPYPVPAAELERLCRYHFPSKLPEYLALGLPVIVSGPEYATGVRWAHAHASAVIAMSNPTVEGFSTLLREIAEDPARRCRLAADGWAAGERDFEPGRIVRQFQEHLRAALTPAK